MKTATYEGQRLGWRRSDSARGLVRLAILVYNIIDAIKLRNPF
jgi:hypothetical protein